MGCAGIVMLRTPISAGKRAERHAHRCRQNEDDDPGSVFRKQVHVHFDMLIFTLSAMKP